MCEKNINLFGFGRFRNFLYGEPSVFHFWYGGTDEIFKGPHGEETLYPGLEKLSAALTLLSF
jgi:hypothetical protein